MAKRQSKKKELDAVNVHNQQEMISLKLHPNFIRLENNKEETSIIRNGLIMKRNIFPITTN